MTALACGRIAAKCPARSLEYIFGFATVAERDGLCDGFGQGRRVGAADGLDGRAVVKDLEGGHGSDAVRAGNVGLVVDVNLCKGNLVRARMLFGEALEVRRDHLARATPIGVDCDALVSTCWRKAERETVQSAMTTVVPESSDCHSPSDPIWMGPLIVKMRA